MSPGGTLPSYYSKLDALGISEYVGWYGDDPLSDVRPALDAVRAQLPGVALFVTEFGAEGNRVGPATTKGTYAFQAQWLDQQLTAMDQTPYLGGAIVWLLRDYAVRPGWSGGNPSPSPPFGRKGLLDLNGKPKPAWALVKQPLPVRTPSGVALGCFPIWNPGTLESDRRHRRRRRHGASGNAPRRSSAGPRSRTSTRSRSRSSSGTSSAATRWTASSAAA